MRVIEIAPIETQSPCRGSFFPKIFVSGRLLMAGREYKANN